MLFLKYPHLPKIEHNKLPNGRKTNGFLLEIKTTYTLLYPASWEILLLLYHIWGVCFPFTCLFNRHFLVVSEIPELGAHQCGKQDRKILMLLVFTFMFFENIF